MSTVVRSSPSRLGEHDLHLFNEGTHRRVHEKLGAHVAEHEGRRGVTFALWAPNAASLSVVGDWNGWDPAANPLAPRGDSGIWEGFAAGAAHGHRYKYHLVSRELGYTVLKADPYGRHFETAPATASIVWDVAYAWGDDAWMRARADGQADHRPMSIYEVHLGSWRRVESEGSRSLGYREIARPLADHVERLGHTHVELLPVMEHPFFGSWGYQVTGYFAPTSRYGTPEDFMYLVDYLHQRGIGVILDWVPAHFPSDPHALGFFDGTHLYEHADPRKGFHPDWNSLIFNYDRNEVRSFLVSSALFWLDVYHADGLRVDGVASMLYLDYSRAPGEWLPNVHGGRENLGAISLLRQVNQVLGVELPGAPTIAEESTAFPDVSRPVERGGLGFAMKWDLGWMHDTLTFFARDPIHRQWHLNELTFRSMYQYRENFVLPLSHDEVVHGKGSLLGKMAGDEWQKRANLRLLYAYQWAMPGKKLLFMGGELGVLREWNHDGALDWSLADDPRHRGLTELVSRLNALYRGVPALHERDFEEGGYEWVMGDSEACVYAFARRARDGRRVLVVLNLTPLPRADFVIGVEERGLWRELLNTDASEYGGSGVGNLGGREAYPVPTHHKPCALTLTLPPLGALYLEAPAEAYSVATTPAAPTALEGPRAAVPVARKKPQPRSKKRRR
ncbi:MAG: 1,4-alpha-glucan branching protein GlgB [Deltaproteobacteria bacterium]|nr:1,4-alpha-glucan branching protein GlgB [Deltaproteobacteria bacterium]